MVPPELHRFIENTTPAIRQKLAAWGIIDAARVAVVTPLRKQIEDWGKWLLNKGTSQEHVDLITSRVTNLFDACGFRFWSDISAERANEQLASWRARAERPLAAQTSNFYRQNARQFCKWMVERGHAPASPLASLAPSNVASDRRHDRRAFEVNEFNWLLGYLDQAPTVMKLPAAERARLYRFAAMTGLRRGAIAKLKVASFDLFGDPPHVYVPAGAGNKYNGREKFPWTWSWRQC